MTAAALARPEAPLCEVPRSPEHLAALRRVVALSPVLVASIRSDRDDLPATQARWEMALLETSLQGNLPRGEAPSIAPAEARRLFAVADAAWVLWRSLLALKRCRGVASRREWAQRVDARLCELEALL